MRAVLFIISLLISLSISSPTGLSNWEAFSIGLFIFFFLDFLNNLGKKMVIFDLTILLAILTCLVMPTIFYHVYTRQNHLAKVWIKYMFMPSDEYFSFAFPAICMMILGFRLPLHKKNLNTEPLTYLHRAKEALKSKPDLGLILIGVGLVSGLFTKFVPGSLTQFFVFLARLIYVGVFYVLYSPSKHKKKIVPLVIIVMLGSSIAIGMFGELIFTSSVSLILIMLGNRTSFFKKLMIAAAGIYFIVLLQSIKMEYRRQAWAGGGGDVGYFAELMADRITSPSKMVEPNSAFLAAVRLNQGWLVSVTMYFVPRKHPFADGETIWQSVAAAVVPRFIWPDKPEAGGKANLKRFWGYNITGYSMNIGPLGEAYGNFGVNGGIIYMFFYGLFFNFLLSWVLRMSSKRPTLFLWIPFLFSGTITFETDLLGTLGVILKGLIFTWLIFLTFKRGFSIDL
jgi:hypothetical protein